MDGARRVAGGCLLILLSGLTTLAPASRLLEQCGGKSVNMLMKVGRFVKDVQCLKMRPGPLHAMADIVDNL